MLMTSPCPVRFRAVVAYPFSFFAMPQVTLPRAEAPTSKNAATLFRAPRTILLSEKTGYAGWHSMDLYSYREDSGRAVAESVNFLRDLESALTEPKLKEIGQLLESGDATTSTRWVGKFILRNVN